MKIFNDNGVLTEEFLQTRWKLLCDIHKQGISSCSSVIGVGTILSGGAKKCLDNVSTLVDLLHQYQVLEEEFLKEREKFKCPYCNDGKCNLDGYDTCRCLNSGYLYEKR